MNALLISFAALATFVSLCDAQCYVIPNESSASDGCKDLSGVTHQLRSDWKTDNCESCHCDDDGIQCCSTTATPMGYDRDKCQAVFNKETCTYTVLEKENPSKTCAVEAWVL